MSPADKLDEIVRALEGAIGNLDDARKKYRILDPNDYMGSYRRALTLARELRAGAVEGYRIAFPNGQNVYYDDADPPDARNVRPALLILSEPTP